MKGKFYKENPSDKIWWLDDGSIGNWQFSFDRKKVYSMFRDYPHAMTPEEVSIFDKENPFWAEFFKNRKEV